MVTEDNYKGKAELERFLNLMDISDDRLRIINSNKHLGYVNDSRILNRTMTEQQYKKSWLYLDGLASEYHTLVQRGIAVNRKKKYQRQLEIEAEMVERMTPFVWKIARSMVYGKGWTINTDHEHKALLSLKDSEIPLEDLVQEGLAKIVDKLPDHDPERGSINAYFRIVVPTKMYYKSRAYTGLLRLPHNIFNHAKTAIKTAIKKEDHRSMKKILAEVASEAPGSVAKSLQGIAIYYGLKRKWVDINGPTGEPGNNSPSHDTFEGRYLEDESEEAKIEEIVGDEELQQKAVTLLETLTSREQDIIKKRFWEGKTLRKVGEECRLSRERIRNLEAQALRKLRKGMSALI